MSGPYDPEVLCGDHRKACNEAGECKDCERSETPASEIPGTQNVYVGIGPGHQSTFHQLSNCPELDDSSPGFRTMMKTRAETNHRKPCLYCFGPEPDAPAKATTKRGVDVEKIQQLRREGKTLKEIATAVGCSPGTAHKYARGIPKGTDEPPAPEAPEPDIPTESPAEVDVDQDHLDDEDLVIVIRVPAAAVAVLNGQTAKIEGLLQTAASDMVREELEKHAAAVESALKEVAA